ncbi:MAG: biotin--[acetyl-CoA-carboxylase] ligase [Spirochaetaceae bacterium]|jgi:BirA family biotin operon repressor/biotin-[acetyl-CoA-carboxylase] ligase|nr:biotin--[acetyl-CoA-carboxylase] ligase [Spirochaetaceae bacterium]
MNNIFNAPIHHIKICGSSMDEARLLVKERGAETGTVIITDFQKNGRGRKPSRVWEAEEGLSLLCTIIMRYKDFYDMPKALPLQTGMCVLKAVVKTAPSLRGKTFVKWPNDVMVNGKKAAGILCETDGSYCLIGIGVNVAQKTFPVKNAASLLTESADEINSESRFILLEHILEHIFYDIKRGDDWIEELNKNLYMKENYISFMKGEADSGKIVRGILKGVGENGELVVFCEDENKIKKFVSGEIILK